MCPIVGGSNCGEPWTHSPDRSRDRGRALEHRKGQPRLAAVRVPAPSSAEEFCADLGDRPCPNSTVTQLCVSLSRAQFAEARSAARSVAHLFPSFQRSALLLVGDAAGVPSWVATHCAAAADQVVMLANGALTHELVARLSAISVVHPSVQHPASPPDAAGALMPSQGAVAIAAWRRIWMIFSHHDLNQGRLRSASGGHSTRCSCGSGASRKTDYLRGCMPRETDTNITFNRKAHACRVHLNMESC